MDHTKNVFSSESNQKNPAKKEVLALKNNVQQVAGEPLLYGIMSKFIKNNKLSKKPSKQGEAKVEEKEAVFPSRENES